MLVWIRCCHKIKPWELKISDKNQVGIKRIKKPMLVLVNDRKTL
jgi:hypothetical protein